MKVNRIKLDEILWEITLDCNKNCEYCGSKDILNKNSNVDIIDIAKEIAKYPPKRITITGGEPIMVGEDKLKEVIKILHDAGISVNVLTNGKLFEHYGILDNVDRVGFSINTLNDIKELKLKGGLCKSNYETVMITNFGTHNIWDFNELANCYNDNNFVSWQVQLTMGEQQLTADAIQHLYNNFETGYNNGDLLVNFQNVIFADNLQKNHECSAGMNCLSILQNGDVVRCLSARSYEKTIETYGNILSNIQTPEIIRDGQSKLQFIFEHEMHSCRFCSELKCCRDLIDYPSYDNKKIPIFEYDKDYKDYTIKEIPITLVYGVTSY